MEAKKLILIILFCLILSSGAFAKGTGTCTLDQASYISSELASFTCVCTDKDQENVLGDMVWIKNDTTILQNTSITSGKCKSEAFTTNLVLPYGNYSFNATFVTLDADWNEPADVVTDDATVLSGSTNTCLITDITFLPDTPLGQLAAAKVILLDSINNGSLIHTHCRVSMYNLINGTFFPIITIPYDENLMPLSIETTTDGELIFLHDFQERIWEINSSYFVEFHCHCPVNTSSENLCVNELTGLTVGFKQCAVVGTFTTGEDFRNLKRDDNLWPFMSVIIVIALASIAVGAYNKSRSVKLLGYGYGVLQLIVALFFVSVNKIGESIDAMYLY